MVLITSFASPNSSVKLRGSSPQTLSNNIIDDSCINKKRKLQESSVYGDNTTPPSKRCKPVANYIDKTPPAEYHRSTASMNYKNSHQYQGQTLMDLPCPIEPQAHHIFPYPVQQIWNEGFSGCGGCCPLIYCPSCQSSPQTIFLDKYF